MESNIIITKNNWYVGMSCIYILLFSISLVSANFVCGTVNDSADQESANWFTIAIFFPSKPSATTSCEVSPENGKYCCDPDAIPPGNQWSIGKQVSAKVFDKETGYITPTVTLTTTGEGYDVFPEVQLEKVITLTSPPKKIIVSNNTLTLLNATFLSPYTKITLEKGKQKTLLCSNCTSIIQNESTVFGKNDWELKASDGTDAFEEKIKFTQLSNLTFKRDFNCKGCSKNNIKENSLVTVTLNLSLSHKVKNILLKEYIPIEWNISNSGNGSVRDYSKTHREIRWNISDKTSKVYYILKAPKVTIRSKGFEFSAELEDYLLKKTNVVVYNLFPFFSKNQKFNQKKTEGVVKQKSNPSKPLITKTKDILVAIYPKRKINNMPFDIEEISKKSNGEEYFFKTNLDRKEIQRIFIRMKISNENGRNKNPLKSFFILTDTWEKNTVKKYAEDNEYVYYEGFIPPARGIKVVKNKNPFSKINIFSLLKVNY